ncbi:uncharacterized protein H6S33_003012 [Morchella sextelata]|uniref:uncharacterized protein n=1 Tax=Morchella sextelata TaxID=1174677 RepID=UPI001D04047C|nr:uncharacterized protein H6S33_003012 [Morchella sextelata]KAH0607024.1 hypothetical protein H6S33_003012 [Morchella sextelata]
MTILEISQRIASLTDAHRECMLLISRLSKLGGTGTDAARLELSNVIHQSLKDADQELELLSTQVDDEIGDGSSPNTAALNSKIHKLTEDMKIARLQYRKAQLASKRLAEMTAQRERERLLSGGGSGRSTPEGKRRNKSLTQADLLIGASTDVTTALRRTHTLLQSELSRSAFATETLHASTAALTDLSSRYSAFDDIVASSRVLISDLIKKNKSDRWYFEHAIYILVSILVWILIRRLLWGPIYLFFGMPLRLAWWGLSCVAWVIGSGGDGGVAEIRRGAGLDESGFVGATPTVEVKGIPESLLVRVPSSTASSMPEASEAMQGSTREESMREKVEKIIDLEEAPSGSIGDGDVHDIPESEPQKGEINHEDSLPESVQKESEPRNMKSRRMDYEPGETVVAQPTEEPPHRDKNPKSRRMEYDQEEERRANAQAAEESQGKNPKSRIMEYDPVVDDSLREEAGIEVERVHDEL